MLPSAVLQAAQLGASALNSTKTRGIFEIRPTAALQAMSNGKGEPIYIKNANGSITRKMGGTLPDIIATAVVEEHHRDRLEITSHPVEIGAAISDHAYLQPPEVTITLGWSNSSDLSTTTEAANIAAAWGTAFGGEIGNGIGAAIGLGEGLHNLITAKNRDVVLEAYASLQNLMTNRLLFTLYTGKRIYKNMLCKGLSTETNNTTENSILITMDCQQVLIVETTLVPLPVANQASPFDTGSAISQGTLSARITPAFIGANL